MIIGCNAPSITAMVPDIDAYRVRFLTAQHSNPRAHRTLRSQHEITLMKTERHHADVNDAGTPTSSVRALRLVAYLLVVRAMYSHAI